MISNIGVIVSFLICIRVQNSNFTKIMTFDSKAMFLKTLQSWLDIAQMDKNWYLDQILHVVSVEIIRKSTQSCLFSLCEIVKIC